MIEHLKSGLSISTHVGCTMGCSYCVLSSLNGFSNGPMKQMEPCEITEALMSGQELFVNGETPLIINNRTDPLLPSVAEDTYRLLDYLIEAKITSPVLLISKFPSTERLKPYFQNLPLMFIYSYSGLSDDCNYKLLQQDISEIQKHVPFESRLHYLRPIIPNRNDDIAHIVETIASFARYGFSGSVMTGLRITNQNRILIEWDTEYDPHHKFLTKGLYSCVLEQLARSEINYPVYRHTSCAIARFMHCRCKLSYYQREGHCNPNCLNSKICARKESVNKSLLNSVLTRHLGENFSGQLVRDDLLIVDSPITQEQMAFLKNAFGLGVQADTIILSPSERSILGHA